MVSKFKPNMDNQSFSDDRRSFRHSDYTDQLDDIKLDDTKLKYYNQYISNYKIDYRSCLTLSSFISKVINQLYRLRSSKKQCLISVFYLWLLAFTSLVTTLTNAQTLSDNSHSANVPNIAQNSPSFSQSSRTVSTKYGIIRGTIITLPNLNLQQVEAFLGEF